MSIATCRLSAPAPFTLAALAAFGLAGCVDVPDRSPMGGDPEPAEAGIDAELDAVLTDGALPRPDVEDHDDPGDPEIDSSSPRPLPVGDGRADGSMPGPEAIEQVREHVQADPRRCPEGGAWLPGVDRCLIVEALPPLPEPRVDLFGCALADGRLLVGGGLAPDENRPRGETWVLGDAGWQVGPELSPPVNHAVAVPADDGVWVVGGFAVDGLGQRAASLVRLLDPDDPEAPIEPVARLNQPRARGFTVSALPDGRRVVAGGYTAAGLAESEEIIEGMMAELIMPLTVQRAEHAAAVDRDGSLWIVGGLDAAGRVRFAPEVLRPGAGDWEVVPGPGGWAASGVGLAPLAEGVLFAGGRDMDGRASARAGRLEPPAEWRAVGDLNVPQDALTLTAVGDEGVVLAVGAVAVEVYDPADERFYLVPTDGRAMRGRHLAVRRPDGSAVVIGGARDGRVMADAFAVRVGPAVAVEPPPDEVEEEQENPRD